MKKTHFIILFLSLICFGCDNGTKLPPCKELSNNYKQDLLSLLPQGIHQVNIQTIRQPKELVTLQKRYKESIQNNYEWFLDYMNSNMTAGKGLPYHENFGLTKSEYNQMGQLLDELKYETVATENITVSYDSNSIQIDGTGILQFYSTISINQDSNLAKIGVHDLNKFDPIIIEDSNNALASSWSGYTWKSEPDSVSLKDINDAVNFSANQLKLTVARLDNTGNRYLSISIKMFENGEAIVNKSSQIIY